jgi:Pentapeptide repeats (8 copies)
MSAWSGWIAVAVGLCVAGLVVLVWPGARARVAAGLVARVPREQADPIIAILLFAAAAVWAGVTMARLGGSMEEPRYHRPAKCEADERVNKNKPPLSDNEFTALLAEQVKYRKIRLGTAPDFSYRRLTQVQANEISKAQDDADKSQSDPPMKGANLAHANLSDISLRGINFSGSDLTCANLINSTLDGVILDEARLEGALFQDVREAEGARFNWVSAAGADFSRANLKKSSFDYAKSLSGATFTDANVTDASFAAANLTDAFWSPVSAPTPSKIARAIGLETLTPAPFGREDTPSLAGLQLLARELRKAGESSAKDKVTRAYEAAETRRMWAEGEIGSLDGATTLVLAGWRRFTWGALTNYGLAPSRALVALAFLAFAFSPLYWAIIPFNGARSNLLYYIRPKGSLDKNGIIRSDDTVEGIDAPNETRRAARALVASCESALNVGFGEVKLAEWLGRLRPTEEEITQVGWPRVVAGIQSLTATIVFILWVWCLLGDPFGDAGAG